MIKRIVLGQIRHLFSSGGGGLFIYLMKSGVSPTDIEAIAAGTVAIVSAIWSAYDKYKNEKEKNA